MMENKHPSEGVWMSCELALCCCAGMRWWLVVASLWLLVALAVPSVQTRNRPRNRDSAAPRGKRRRDGNGA